MFVTGSSLVARAGPPAGVGTPCHAAWLPPSVKPTPRVGWRRGCLADDKGRRVERARVRSPVEDCRSRVRSLCRVGWRYFADGAGINWPGEVRRQSSSIRACADVCRAWGVAFAARVNFHRRLSESLEPCARGDGRQISRLGRRGTSPGENDQTVPGPRCGHCRHPGFLDAFRPGSGWRGVEQSPCGRRQCSDCGGAGRSCLACPRRKLTEPPRSGDFVPDAAARATDA